MGARKAETFPVQILALTQIVVDHSLQSRVATSVEYQREFSEAMLRGDQFPPVTVFFDGKKYWLADGFHRFGATKQAAKVDRKFEGVRAEVRTGTKRDAMVFSAGANIKFSIPRTLEDKNKAIRMILDDQEGFSWADTRISEHCGIGRSVVVKCRAAYCAEKGIAMPVTIRGSSGKVMTRKGGRYGTIYKARRSVNGRDYPMFCASIGGKRVYLGSDEANAKRRYDELKSEREIQATSIRDFSLWASYRGCVFTGEMPSMVYGGMAGLSGHGCAVVATLIDDAKDLVLAVGRVLLLQRLREGASRAVVLCPEAGRPAGTVELARQLGVEFLTPEEFVASLKGGNPTDRADDMI